MKTLILKMGNTVLLIPEKKARPLWASNTQTSTKSAGFKHEHEHVLLIDYYLNYVSQSSTPSVIPLVKN
jgi:hypothetical protein